MIINNYHRTCISQEEKGTRWMPWHKEAKKDVLICEKLRGADKER